MIQSSHMVVSEQGDLPCERKFAVRIGCDSKKGSVYVVQLLLISHKGFPDICRT